VTLLNIDRDGRWRAVIRFGEDVCGSLEGAQRIQ